MKYTVIKDIEKLKEEVNNIFTDVYNHPGKVVELYLNWTITVVFKNKQYFIYEPFECFEQMDKYYSVFKEQNKDIEYIFIQKDYTTDMYGIFGNVEDTDIINSIEKFYGNFDDFMYNYYVTKNYINIDFIYDNEEE